MKVFTKTITTPLTISKSDGVFFVSVLVGSNSTLTILGNGNGFQGLTPDSVSLADGQTWSLHSQISEGAIDGVTLTPSGTVYLQVGYN